MSHPQTVAGEADQGTDTTFEGVYRTYYRRVRAYHYHQVHDWYTADDLTAETFLHVMRAMKSPTFRPYAINGLIFRIAYRRFIDHIRANRRLTVDLTADMTEHDLPSAPGSLDEIILSQEMTAILARAMATLPQQQLAAVFLHEIGGYSSQEAADIIGTSPGAVRVAKHRGLTNLAKRLGGAPTA